MPKVTVWIREEDKENWLSIDDIPGWLHFHLNHGIKVVTRNPDGSGKVEDILNAQDALSKVKVPTKNRYMQNSDGNIYGPS